MLHEWKFTCGAVGVAIIFIMELILVVVFLWKIWYQKGISEVKEGAEREVGDRNDSVSYNASSDNSGRDDGSKVNSVSLDMGSDIEGEYISNDETCEGGDKNDNAPINERDEWDMYFNIPIGGNAMGESNDNCEPLHRDSIDGENGEQLTNKPGALDRSSHAGANQKYLEGEVKKNGTLTKKKMMEHPIRHLHYQRTMKGEQMVD
mmetsp:Transcript_15024/g.33496  ORF Transcript_15024/g.33496 Transcript_15024/m.33496 type:complete len:205 (-) Transcript_15024:249-863(-)